ncbi:MAG: type II toxin-antitoxin system prevent-host-death family antitoxin [Chloroflexi bacterium]|nr:type II toxin-antitoxin system prevent-host-death family antitoxin [Chloroflexota bacterium]
MREVRATEAKARLSELLRSVEFGESITITRNGTPVAKLVPAHTGDVAARAAAVARFRRRRAGMKRLKMSVEEIVADRRAGHRM